MSPLERINLIVDGVTDVSPTSKLVLLVLARHVNAESQCFPSQLTIADKCGLSSRAVVSAVRELIARDHVSVVRGNRHKGHANLYSVHPRAVQVKEVHVNQVHVKEVHVNDVPSSSAPRASHQVHHVPTKVIIEVEHRRGSDLPTASRPSIKPPVKSSKKAKTSTVDPRHGEVVTHWCESFQKARGCKATFGGREATLIQQLIAKLGHDGAKATIDRALADSFWKDKITLVQLVSDPDKFRTANANASATSYGRPKQTAVAAGSDWTKQ